MRTSTGLDPSLFGTLCCVFAAVGYTAANVCLRALASGDDQVWVICVKETVSVLVVGPLLAWMAWRGRRVMPDWRSVVWLLLAGLAVQLVGNLGTLWSMDVIGLSVTIPVAMGMNLAGSAILGWILLRERVPLRSALAIGLLIMAIVFLQSGATTADAWVSASAGRIGLAVLVCCLAGITFALLAIAIRRTMTANVHPAAALFIVTSAGLLSLGPLSLCQFGWEGLLATPGHDFRLMVLAGVLNLVAFGAIIMGLRYATVVRVNVLNASQVAMAAVAGMLFFGEVPSSQLAVGIGLTVVSVAMIGGPAE